MEATVKKEVWTFSLLMAIGLGLAIAKNQNVRLPNPLDWLIVLYRPLSEALFGMLT